MTMIEPKIQKFVDEHCPQEIYAFGRPLKRSFSWTFGENERYKVCYKIEDFKMFNINILKNNDMWSVITELVGNPGVFGLPVNRCLQNMQEAIIERYLCDKKFAKACDEMFGQAIKDAMLIRDILK